VVVTALYRRYRPEAFAELIGQSQVTEPLMTALRTNRVNHAYLFSGPRGCGKTTSARILARCLNCVDGPTDTPCGVCPSCVELSRDGGGSLDVVEIDAASHNGVDDARDLRERAVFAPARDRYKIFILDEAHMVTPQGFNALLKIVEEPPEHVKFIFATTEPDKVIGTIRSRTHHYPFRLVPPAQMLEYVQQLCDSEKVVVAPGVLPLVVRAGGGSVRDTLSLLDQLIAGSEADTVEYERAVALLGYTHASLLGEVIDAIGAIDAAAAFSAVDRVIQTGQDPRRFVEDLLERLRDLIVVSATGRDSAAVLRGIQQDELDQMAEQAAKFGSAELSRAADVVAGALTEMTGATSPRLHLELMIARVLVPAADSSARGTLARVERLERRVGVEGAAVPPEDEATTRPPVKAETSQRAPDKSEPAPAPSRSEPTPPLQDGDARIDEGTKPAVAATAVSFQQLSDAWAEILEVVGKAKRAAWAVAFTAKPVGLKDDVLALAFPSQNDVDNFKKPQAANQSVSELLRQAIIDVLGLRVKFIARADAAAARSEARNHEGLPEDTEPPQSSPTPQAVPDASPEPETKDAAGWAVAQIPTSTPQEPAEQSSPAQQSATPQSAAQKPDVQKPATQKSEAQKPATQKPATQNPATQNPTIATKAPAGAAPLAGEKQRYGEAVVREILGASFIEEQSIESRVTPTQEG